MNGRVNNYCTYSELTVNFVLVNIWTGRIQVQFRRIIWILMGFFQILTELHYSILQKSTPLLLDTTLCDTICLWLPTGQWFSPGIPFSSINKTDRHDITKILLKVALNTITLTPLFFWGKSYVKMYSNW